MLKKVTQLTLAVLSLPLMHTAYAWDFNKPNVSDVQSQASSYASNAASNYAQNAITGTSAQVIQQSYHSPVTYYPQVILDGQVGSNMYGTLDFMLPFLTHGDSLFFLDVRGQKSNLNRFELNGGLGFRHVLSDNYLFGLYGYYDYKASLNNKAFSEATVGTEFLGVHWDFRINGYLPVGINKQLINSVNNPVAMEGHALIANTVNSFEVAQPGVDAEVGRLIWGGINHPMRAYVGAYDFFPSNGAENIAGGRFRLTQQITSYFSVNATYQYDVVRKSQEYFGLRFTFGGVSQHVSDNPSNNEILHSRMMDMVQRDSDVVTSTVAQTTPNFQLPEQIYYVKAGAVDGDGTLGHPFNNISEALTQSSGVSDSIVYVYNVNGATYSLPAQTMLVSGQDIRGSGVGLTVDGANFISAGEAPTVQINDNSGFAGIVMASGSSLQGWNVVGTGTNSVDTGILMPGVNNVTLSNMQVSGFNQALLVNAGATNITLNIITATNNKIGLTISNVGTQNITVNQGNYSNNSNNGIDVMNGANNIVLNNVTATNNSNGLTISDAGTQNITVNQGNYSHNMNNGINVLNDASNLIFNNVTADQNNGSGLYIPTKDDATTGGDSNIQNIVMNDGDYSHNAISGIVLKDVKHVTIDGVNASNNGGSSDPDAGYGLLIGNGAQDITMGGNKEIIADRNTQTGLLVTGNGSQSTDATTNINILHGEFDGNGDNGIEFGNDVAYGTQADIPTQIRIEQVEASSNIKGSGIKFDNDVAYSTANNNDYGQVRISSVTANNNGLAGIEINAGSSHMSLMDINAADNQYGLLIAGGSSGAQSIDSIAVGGASQFTANHSDGIHITGSTGTDAAYKNIYPLVFSGVTTSNNGGNGVSILSNGNSDTDPTGGYSQSLFFSGLTANANKANGLLMGGAAICMTGFTMQDSALTNNGNIGFYEMNGGSTVNRDIAQAITNTSISGNGKGAIDTREINLIVTMAAAGQIKGLVSNEYVPGLTSNLTIKIPGQSAIILGSGQSKNFS